MPKLSIQKYSTQILLSIDRMQITIFLQEVKEALFGARCWDKQAKSSNFYGLQDNPYLEARLHDSTPRQWIHFVNEWIQK